jgi:D-serine deaminase-like pyridoxal phosphate-dependent protein
VFKQLNQIKTPTLLVDEKKCRQNIFKMVEKSHRLGLELRPHFKTHQSRSIGEWFKESGVHKIAVSSLGMAEYFAHARWDDILVALPVNVLEVDIIQRLTPRVNLTIVVDNMTALVIMAKKLSTSISIMVEIDVGQHRSGMNWDDTKAIAGIVDFISSHENYNFAGFMCHGGQTYQAKSKEEVLAIHEENLAKLNSVTEPYRSKFPEMIVSYGDTPSCSLSTNFKGVDEIRPGNYVFYDLMQQQIGSCTKEEIAVATFCPIIGTYPESGKAIIYGGAVHFSKDHLQVNGAPYYGSVVFMTENGWEFPDVDIPVVRLSQEHGTIAIPPGYENKFNIGELVGIVPVHSCLAASNMTWYRTLEGGHQLDHMLGNT